MSAIPRPSSWRGRTVSFGILVAVAVYVGMLAFPSPLFPYTVSSGELRLHSHRPLDSSAASLLSIADARLKTSPMNGLSRRHDIYLVDSPTAYWFFSRSRALAVTYPLFHTTFLSPSDTSHDLVGTESPDPRRLSSVMTHERVHVLEEKYLGLVRYEAAPKWKIEGYADYVAGEHDFDVEAVRESIHDNGLASIADLHHGYVLYHLRTRYLLGVQHVSVDDFWTKDFDLAALDSNVAANIDSVLY